MLKRLNSEAAESLSDLWVKGLQARRTRRKSPYRRPLCCAAPVILFGLMVACSSKKAANSGFFPASNVVPGWIKSSDTRTFEASHLWEYVDGDADKYVQAGVVETLTSDYRFNGKTDAAVDVYVMSAAAGAQKIYESESAEGSEPLRIGDAGRYAQGSLTFRHGPYFVRMVAFEDSPGIATALTHLARGVSSRLDRVPADK